MNKFCLAAGTVCTVLLLVNFASTEDSKLKAIASDEGNVLKQTLDYLVDKMIEQIRNGQSVSEDLIEKAGIVRQKLKDISQNISPELTQKLMEIREQAFGTFEKLREKLGLGR